MESGRSDRAQHRGSSSRAILMRILYVHQFYASPTSGTAGTRSYDVARALADRGHKVTVLTTDAELSSSMSAIREAHGAGFILRVMPSRYRNSHGYALRSTAFLWFAIAASIVVARGGYDLVYATSTPLTVGLPALIGRTIRGIPYIFEVRDLWPEVPVAAGILAREGILHRVARGLERICYRRSSGVVALSEGMRKGVLVLSPGTPTVVVPNFARLHVPSGVPPSWAQMIRDQHRFLIVYTGSFGWMNDLLPWVDLAAQSCREVGRRCGLAVCGGGRG